MEVSGLHLLLTYQCSLACDHCFVWGSPWQSGTMGLKEIREILRQARELGTVGWIFFEGGEPFLYYPVLVKGVEEAAHEGFQVGLVTNGYWATEGEDALEWLRPFVGLIQDLSVSSDLYHWDEKLNRQAENAVEAATKLGIPVGVISIAQPEGVGASAAEGQLPPGESAVMYRGRAAQKLAARAPQPRPWREWRECPYENLRDPGRVHVDPLGHVHICQGISLGNLFRTPLREICGGYDASSHPITGPLLEGGPAELVRRYGLAHGEEYADACHLCYEARLALRDRFPEILTPDQMYGAFEAS
ncbi:MAG: radical SAM protein [Chloroflexi bacterium]|nr:radical SAM protein [Chloroflexota bacterium]